MCVRACVHVCVRTYIDACMCTWACRPKLLSRPGEHDDSDSDTEFPPSSPHSVPVATASSPHEVPMATASEDHSPHEESSSKPHPLGRD